MSYWLSSWIYLVNLPVPLGEKSSLLKAAVMKLRKFSALLGEGGKVGGGRSFNVLLFIFILWHCYIFQRI